MKTSEQEDHLLDETNHAPTELVFQVSEAIEGGYNAKALGHSIFTQGDDWNDLKTMVVDAVQCHFEGGELPKVILLHFVRNEYLTI